ncbi:deoxyribodipyrimidine photolyase-related protein [Glaciihabitans tibetensis]|uniref:Deoxyribodipyrimidine photolyase-related protein n=1 Tax=Glaciihabitans tibetensis TaxID=1266600 RepID=A0A2T0VGM4_9MICO|nr:cryptochrome/photolyase family protein [Glaciihabitans tibetensis]PRY69362.1 deoxyribodipyrimidine photolyase-related protein [Glaciihabitans tibetensis]
MSPGPRVRLVLPHQLFDLHFEAGDDTVFVLIEHDLLFRQYAFHSHKLVLHRASMARFANRLRDHGYEVETLRSDAAQSSHDQLAAFVRDREPAQVTWFDVVDDWLEQDLFAALADGGYRMLPNDILETPNFLTDRGQIDDWFSQNISRMQDFYVWQRRRLNILLDDGRPVGGKWSFDAENRKKLPRGYTPRTVSRFARHPVLGSEGTFDIDALMADADTAGTADGGDAEVSQEVTLAIAWVSEEFPNAPGDPHLFAWPTSGDEARAHLREFVRERLNDFGPYEDAISTVHPFISHGLLTGALNVGLLDPREVIQTVLEGADHTTPLASLEGFVRQVIGWREYMRATYRTGGRRMRTSNRLNHQNALGDGWWDATTGLAPVDLVISRVLDTGYAHHIERLMVLGNAMSLLRIHPDAVYEWFMELFIDAYDWVMVPNVYAMSQFAAGAEFTTKPYVSGSNYLRKMSDLPAGEWSADWDGLYWAFIDDHREVFASNPRTRMVVSLLDKMDPTTRADHRRRADALLDGGPSTRLLTAPPTPTDAVQ